MYDDEHPPRPTKRIHLGKPPTDNFFRRSILEQRTALDLIGLANQQANLDFNGDHVSSLLSTLIVSHRLYTESYNDHVD